MKGKSFSVLVGVMLALVGFIILAIVNTYLFGDVKTLATAFTVIFIFLSVAYPLIS